MEMTYPHANRCTATSKRSGEQCKNRAVTGSKTCRMHGGTVRKGILNSNFKTGRYSKYIPLELVDLYNTGKDDPDILSLRDEIAVIDARNNQLLQSLSSKNSRALWSKLRDEYQGFITAVDDKEQKARLQNIFRIINEGGKDFEIWSEIIGNMETRRRLSDSERKRVLDANLTISADHAMGLIIAMMSAFKTNVYQFTDKQTASRILSATGRDISNLIGENGR